MKLKITKVEVRDAELFGSDRFPSRYGNPMVQHRTEAKQLFVKGMKEDGTPVSFYTPATKISVASGMLNYKKIQTENGWFKEVDHGYSDVKNALYYEGSTEMPVAIFHKVEIVPAVAVGDEIEISSYKIKGKIGREERWWYVKK